MKRAFWIIVVTTMLFSSVWASAGERVNQGKASMRQVAIACGLPADEAAKIDGDINPGAQNSLASLLAKALQGRQKAAAAPVGPDPRIAQLEAALRGAQEALDKSQADLVTRTQERDQARDAARAAEGRRDQVQNDLNAANAEHDALKNQVTNLGKELQDLKTAAGKQPATAAIPVPPLNLSGTGLSSDASSGSPGSSGSEGSGSPGAAPPTVRQRDAATFSLSKIPLESLGAIDPFPAQDWIDVPSWAEFRQKDGVWQVGKWESWDVVWSRRKDLTTRSITGDLIASNLGVKVGEIKDFGNNIMATHIEGVGLLIKSKEDTIWNTYTYWMQLPDEPSAASSAYPEPYVEKPDAETLKKKRAFSQSIKTLVANVGGAVKQKAAAEKKKEDAAKPAGDTLASTSSTATRGGL